MTAEPDNPRRTRRLAAPPILQNGFRPFFLGGALLAAVSVPLWALAFYGHAGEAAGLATRHGHVHEMLFGYLAAIIAGFALTAIPNWTGRLPVAGWPLLALFALWLLGRGHVFAPEAAIWLAADLAFFFVFALIAAAEIVSGRNWRNLPVVGLLAAFAAAHALAHVPGVEAYGERAALGAAACLIGLIGGRITPSFTRNWLTQMGLPTRPAPVAGFDRLALIALLLALGSWVLVPDTALAGSFLVIAGMMHVARLARWRGWVSASEPMVWSLHAGYAWLAAGLLLLGVSILSPGWVPYAAGMHALAAGAVGAMTLAVMTRASRGHTGRSRAAGPATTAIYLLVHAGALARVFAAFAPPGADIWLIAGAGLWSGAFALFVIVYAPMLSGPRSDANKG
ncbi:MAG: NnrS family protein [Maricaulaceae bacterium]|nr:NnrS family protein [Maricaulaceae bacterium]